MAAQISYRRSELNEESLYVELHNFFQHLKETVLHELHEYWKDDDSILLEGQLDLILAPIFESQQKYYNILRKHNIKEYNFGCREARRLVKLARKPVSSLKAESNTIKVNKLANLNVDKDELFGTNDWTQQKLLNQSFTASENTMNRVDQDINKIISDGYASGAGVNKVAANIETRFEQLKTWESKRIARTEMHNAHQMGIMNTYYEMGVEYTQWSAARDKRTRDSHRELDGEIIPLGGTYSNDCQYPGDTKGPIKEWINCRCGNVPFIMPDGYIAPPGKAQFRESDLIQTLDYWNQDELITRATQEAQTTSFDEERFKALKTNEELADFFGYEYIPKGRYYEQANIKTFEFYDKKTDTILRFAREGDQKCLNIDFTNSGKCEYDLKDVLRIYDETHPNLKVGLDDITFLRGDKYTPGGDACGCSVRIFDENIRHSFSKRGIHAEVEPLEHTLDHELGHIFSDSFVQENEYNVLDDVAISIRKDFKTAGVNDDLHHQKMGLTPQKVSHYAEKNQSENFAEVTAGVSNLKRGNNYKVYAEHVRRPDESKISGFVRDKPTLKEVKARNPNQYEYVDNLLDHPETVMKNWKSINQQRVKESRAHFNEFLKQEQKVVRAKQVNNYDKYKLDAKGQEVYDKLKNKKTLTLPERKLLNRLDSLNEFNELHNKKLVGKIFDDDLEKTYQKLKRRYGDYVQLKEIDLKPITVKKTGIFKNEDAFELTLEEQRVFDQLHVQKKLWKSKLPQEFKIVHQQLADKQELSRLHQKMLDYRLTAEQSDTYIELYYKYKQQWKLPKINKELSDKFTIRKPYFLNYEEFGEINKVSDKFKLTSKQQQELDELNKIKFLNNGKLTKTQEKKLNKLLAQKDFNDLYSLRIQNKGLNYRNNKKYKQAYETLKRHKYKFPKNSEVGLFQDLTPKNQHIKVEWKEPSNGKYKHLKGSYEDGLTLELRNNFDDYFTIDCRNLTPHQKEHMDYWLYKGHDDISEFLRHGDGDIEKFAKWFVNNPDHGGTLENAVERGKKLKYTCDIIEDILDKSYLKKSLVGYRRQRNHHLADYLPKGEKIIPGKTIVPLKGITSVAVTEEGANYYVETAGKTLEEMKWLFEIEMPTGTRGSYVSHVTIDKYKPEMEFLTKRDTYVKIIEFNEKNHYAKLRIVNTY
ncbi:MAG: minor capsid protein [Methanobrevibacter sp.]|nr:minor capsid protein [Methanobrevibacter sp.]